uniref:Fucosyltransferase n=1 Tax=Oryza nivara TaxID=4536 RepID=A0A0E0G667_ORYNI
MCTMRTTTRRRCDDCFSRLPTPLAKMLVWSVYGLPKWNFTNHINQRAKSQKLPYNMISGAGATCRGRGLDDEAEVEARDVVERLDAAEEGRVWGRDGGAVEHGGVDLDLLILGAAGGVEAHPRGRHRRPLLTVERRGSREEGGEKVSNQITPPFSFPSSLLPYLICEQFPGSTWTLPEGDFPFSGIRGFNACTRESLGNALRRGKGAARDPLPPWITTYFNRNGNEPRFFCDDGLDALWRVDWMVLLSDNYFVLGLFLVSRIERVLPRMFPCHDAAFHLLGRYLLHPRNVRTSCPVCSRSSTLPLPESSRAARPGRRRPVLVVSLHGAYSERIKDLYYEQDIAGRESMSVFQPTHLDRQQSGEKLHNQEEEEEYDKWGQGYF